MAAALQTMRLGAGTSEAAARNMMNVIPGIRPTLTLMLILTVIWSFQVFEFIFIVTRGGPAYGSEVLATFAYRHAFFEGDVGQAAAAACVMSLFGLCATAVYLWLQITDDAQST